MEGVGVRPVAWFFGPETAYMGDGMATAPRQSIPVAIAAPFREVCNMPAGIFL